MMWSVDWFESHGGKWSWFQIWEMAPFPVCKVSRSSMFLDIQHVLIPCEFCRLSAAVQIASSAMRSVWSVGLLYWSRWKYISKWKFWVGVYCKGRHWVVKIASVELFWSAGFVVMNGDWHFQTLMCAKFLDGEQQIEEQRFFVVWSFLCTKGSQYCFLPTFPTCY